MLEKFNRRWPKVAENKVPFVAFGATGMGEHCEGQCGEVNAQQAQFFPHCSDQTGDCGGFAIGAGRLSLDQPVKEIFCVW